MKSLFVTAGLAVVGWMLASIPVIAQVPAARPFKIVTLDPALQEIIAPDANLETLGIKGGRLHRIIRDETEATLNRND